MTSRATPPDLQRRTRRERGGGPVRSILGWIGEHVRGFHAAVGLFLTIGLTLVLVAGALFAIFAALVVREATLAADEAALLWLDARRTESLDRVMMEITALGGGFMVMTVVVIGSFFLWETRHRYSAMLLWVAALGGFLLNYLLKELYGRVRPELFEWVVPAGHLSFPSGHSMNAIIAYGTLAFLVIRLEPTRRLRRFTWSVAALLVLLVGFSRPYLGVHYPSDVIAGFLIGAAWAAVCALGIEAVRFFRSRNPAVERVERDLDSRAL